MVAAEVNNKKANVYYRQYCTYKSTGTSHTVQESTVTHCPGQWLGRSLSEPTVCIGNI